jgi:hypothetical protein
MVEGRPCFHGHGTWDTEATLLSEHARKLCLLGGGEPPTTLHFVEFSRSCHTWHQSESGHILDVEVYTLGLLGSYPHTLGLQDPRVLQSPLQLIKVLVSRLTWGLDKQVGHILYCLPNYSCKGALQSVRPVNQPHLPASLLHLLREEGWPHLMGVVIPSGEFDCLLLIRSVGWYYPPIMS